MTIKNKRKQKHKFGSKLTNFRIYLSEQFHHNDELTDVSGEKYRIVSVNLDSYTIEKL